MELVKMRVGRTSTGRQRSAAAAAAAAAPHKKSNGKAKPLELLVVGQQLTMRPMFRRTTKPMPTVAAPAPTSEAEDQPAAAAAAAGVRVRSQCGPPFAEQLFENGDYMYVYKACPCELWSHAAELYMPQESPQQPQRLVKRQQHQQQRLPIVQQVLDARFLAELFDELLLCAE